MNDKDLHYQILILFAVLGLAITVVGFSRALNVGKPTVSATGELVEFEPVRLPKIVKNIDEGK